MKSQREELRKRKEGGGVTNIVKRYWKYRQLMILMLPGLAFIIIFNYIPMYGITLAFKDFRASEGILGSPWIDPLFKNFEILFKAPSFYEILRNTVFISFVKIVLGFISKVGFAILLNELSNRYFKKIVQTISYMPNFLSWVILASFVIEVCSPSRGIINMIIKALGGTPINFLIDSRSFLGVIFVSNIWATVGWGSIIYLAAITNIDPQLYEAARSDGANRFQCIIHITLPQMAPVMIVMLILDMGNILNAGFDQIFNLYNPLVYSTADIIDTYVYRIGMTQMKYSLSTAVGLFKNIIAFSMVMLVNSVARRLSEHSLW